MKSPAIGLPVWTGIMLAFVLPTKAIEYPGAFDIPKVESITVDGKADDWAGSGFRVDALADAQGKIQRASQFDARFRLGWDERGLLVMATVHDVTPFEDPRMERLAKLDSIEIFVAEKADGMDGVQIFSAPGRTSAQKACRTQVSVWKKNEPEVMRN